MISEVSFRKIVLIATHVVSDVEFIANGILLLKQGELLRIEPRENLTGELQGKVHELEIGESQLMGVTEKFQVAGVMKEREKLYVRVIAGGACSGYKSREVRPSLEDVYLHYFEE